MSPIIYRILTAIPLIFGVSFLSFLIMHIAPGDPTLMYMDPTVSRSDLAQVRQNLGLDQPLLIQYVLWLKQLLQGNLGYSYVTGKPVLQAILERLPATLLLSVSSLIIILLITFPLGLLCGYKKDTWIDDSITIVSFLGLSIPTFGWGLCLSCFFHCNWIGFQPLAFWTPC